MYTIEIQTPSEAELLEQLQLAERELLMLDKDDQVLSQLSLTILSNTLELLVRPNQQDYLGQYADASPSSLDN